MNYAMVIGINDYLKRPLKGAVGDAEDFSKWLISSGQVEEKNLKLLVSTEKNEIARIDHVDTAFLQILKDAKEHLAEKNRLYFYFSGHGVGVSYTNTGLCLRLWQNDLPHYNISSRAYQDCLVNKGIFDEIIIVLDCCRDYDFLVDPKTPTLDVSLSYDEVRTTNFLIFYSTIYGKVSHEIKKDIHDESKEDQNKKRGAFTSFLLEGLKGDADVDGDGVITGNDLVSHIRDNFKSYALKHNKIQDADTWLSGAGMTIKVCEVSKTNLGYNYIITFDRASNISIYDGSNNLISTANSLKVEKGQELKIQLPKGLIRIVDNNEPRREKYLTNYNQNTVTNEYF